MLSIGLPLELRFEYTAGTESREVKVMYFFLSVAAIELFFIGGGMQSLSLDVDRYSQTSPAKKEEAGSVKNLESVALG